jgi:hypothetical protein
MARIKHRGCLSPDARGRVGRPHEYLNHDITMDVHEPAWADADIRDARQRPQAAAMPIEEVSQSDDLFVPCHR